MKYTINSDIPRSRVDDYFALGTVRGEQYSRRWQSSQAESLQNWGRIEEFCLRRGIPLVAIGMMSKRNNYFFPVQSQNLSYTVPFQIDRLLEIEMKRYR